MEKFGRSNLTNNKLPFMHLNARSRRIKRCEIREVYIQEISRFLPQGIDQEKYVQKVMP